MGTTLTLAEYSSRNWEALELSEDAASYRKFWAAVLQFALADGADALWYCRDFGSDCLFTQIGEQQFPLEPPPSEYRAELFAAVRDMAASSTLSRIANDVMRLCQGTRELGRIRLESANGDIEWSLYESSKGICIQLL